MALSPTRIIGIGILIISFYLFSEPSAACIFERAEGMFALE
jgi:hypothetical protein